VWSKQGACAGHNYNLQGPSAWGWSGVQGVRYDREHHNVRCRCLQVVVRAATAPLTSQQRALLHTAIRRGRTGQQQQVRNSRYMLCVPSLSGLGFDACAVLLLPASLTPDKPDPAGMCHCTAFHSLASVMCCC
jgi:hypothetical protein